MQRKFQYSMLGSGLTILVILGAFALIFSQVQASPTNEGTISNNDVLPETAIQITRPSTPEAQTENAISEITLVSSEEIQKQASEPVDSPAIVKAVESSFSVEQAVPSASVENDPKLISAVLFAFAEQQEKTLFNEPGWLHVQGKNYVPTALRGNGSAEMPMNELFPEDVAFFEDWYHVDEVGIVNESLHYITSPDNIIRQQSIFTDGKLVNLTAKLAGVNREQYESMLASMMIHQLTRSYAEMIESMSTWNGEFAASLNQEGLYTVSFTQYYPDGLVDWRFAEPVMASKTVYTFDSATGFLISVEGQFLVADEWVIHERTEYLVIEFVGELPNDVAQLFAQSLTTLREEN